MTDFLKCVEFNFRGKVCEIKCKRNLWSVSGPDYRKLHKEAKSYWYQYWCDDEYDELLGDGV